MKLVFMGTPDFAVPSLEMLAQHHDVVGVVTAVDKPAGRGKKLRVSAVKSAAENLNLPVLQPENLKDPDFHQKLKALGAELFVVVAFRMLPEAVWDMPPKGTINLHASLLPQYRGAAPINRAIMNGEKSTGLTTFFIEREIDTGFIIEQAELKIGPDEDAGSLHDRMMNSGAKLLKQTVDNIASGEVEPKPQTAAPGVELKPAPKIFKTDCQIDWNQTATDVHNHIRGLSPYPTAWTVGTASAMDDANFKVYTSRICTNQNALSPGETNVREGKLFVGTITDDIEITELQPAGKKRMATEAWLRGFSLPDDFKFI